MKKKLQIIIDDKEQPFEINLDNEEEKKIYYEFVNYAAEFFAKIFKIQSISPSWDKEIERMEEHFIKTSKFLNIKQKIKDATIRNMLGITFSNSNVFQMLSSIDPDNFNDSTRPKRRVNISQALKELVEEKKVEYVKKGTKGTRYRVTYTGETNIDSLEELS